MRLSLPDPALIVLVGTTGSGKTTFARRHFRATEVLSSDAFRAVVADDESDQGATSDAFEILHLVAARRLARRRITVIDATNVLPSARSPLLALAARHAIPAVAIVLDVPTAVCAARNRDRPDRRVDDRVLARQRSALQRSKGSLAGEGFVRVVSLGPDEIDRVVVDRQGSERAAPGDPAWESSS